MNTEGEEKVVDTEAISKGVINDETFSKGVINETISKEIINETLSKVDDEIVGKVVDETISKNSNIYIQDLVEKPNIDASHSFIRKYSSRGSHHSRTSKKS